MTWSRWISCSLAAGITLFLVGAAVHLLVPILQPGIPPQYVNHELLRPWTGWTSTYMVLHPFAYGFVFAAAFVALRRWSSFPSGVHGYSFDVSCQGTVPEAIMAFLDADSYEDAVRNAISLGGDSDTLACITGGIAEAFHGARPSGAS